MNKAKGRFEKYEFEVGVLEHKPYRSAEPKSKGLKKFLAGPARKVSKKSAGLSVARVSFYNRRKTDYFRKPFKRRSSDIIRFSKEFFKLCAGTGEERRVLNYLQAIVRNPILRGDYGPNAPATVRTKGFDRYMIDTGQLFNSIKARVSRVRKRS